MGIGILAGLALSGPAAQAADYLTAHPTTQTFYLDGEKIDLTAYLIGGSNYVRLRDIGRAVDFGVTYDAATNSVYIDPDAHYEQEVIQSSQVVTSGITEESVQAALADLRQIYPPGTVFPAPYRSTSNGPYSRGIHCSGWATLCSDAAFGSLPWRRIDRPTWDQLRPGDIVEYKNEKSYHAVVVVRKTAEYIVVTESSTNNRAVWGGQYFRWWLEEQPHYISYTRYPQ
ncbi:MAG: hypothetical protein HDT38_02675 [Clostridiales bacterium]|nr:hypothetical protein [Clostridiales bacterium]